MQLRFREYQKQDFNPLKEIIRETWHYDEFSSPKTASKLAEVFLSSCLTNYTFSQVAVLDDKVVGIILVKDVKIHQCPPGNRLRQIKSVIKLYLSKEGRSVSQIFKDVNEINKQLLDNCHKTYPAELACFLQALFPQKCRLNSSKLHGEFPQYCISSAGTLSGAGEEPLQAYKVY